MSSTHANDKGPISGLASVSALLVETGLYSDFTVNCQGRVWKLHRIIVLPQSKVLAARIDGNFKEGITREINLPDDDPKIFDRLIQFLSKETFDDEASTNEVSEDSHLTIYTKVYVLAEKYDIPSLKELATSKFKKAVAPEWNPDSLATSLELMYTELPDSDLMLKKVAIEAASEHIGELVDRAEFESMCKKYPGVAFDIFKGFVASMHPRGKFEKCPKHGTSQDSCIYWHYFTSQYYCADCRGEFK
ncbi:hypothetical protein EG329_012407 [Mollisiaceae sp. DMI_Dod_QoI]|nr:hypothetical protein EG329_012407 [Helotiales sp. DMI_Dod_QoI]